MIRVGILRRLGLSVALAILAASVSAPALSQESVCSKSSVAGLEDVWLYSLVEDGSGVLASDPIAQRVIKLSDEGKIVEEYHDLGNSPAGFAPALMQRLDDGSLLLGNANNEILHVVPGVSLAPRSAGGPVHRDFTVLGTNNPLYADRSGSGDIGSFYGWSVTDDGHLLAYADWMESDGSWASGFVWMNQADPSQFTRVRQVSLDSKERTFYLVMHPYVTTIGDKAYFLAMKEKPVIVEYDGQRSRELDVVPAEVQMRPELPPKRGLTSVPKLFASLEAATMPVGLYAWEGDLWLLARRSGTEPGQTDWSLTRIDPDGGASGDAVTRYTLHLPTGHAKHLALAPGSPCWTVLVKGEVKGLGRQDVREVVRLSSDWLLHDTPKSAAGQ